MRALCRRASVCCALLTLPLLTFTAGAQLAELPRSGADLFAPAGGCGAASAAVGEAIVGDASLLFYSIPDDTLVESENSVEVRVWIDGEIWLQESFRLRASELEAREQSRVQGLEAPAAEPIEASGRTVFELLAERGETRAELERLASVHPAEVEILVNGTTVEHLDWGSFARLSEQAVEAHGLPVASGASSKLFSPGANPETEVEGCGDGHCALEENADSEDCESCPEDCGGPCTICGNAFCGPSESCSTCPDDCGPCSTCPEYLGSEERNEYLGSSYLYSQCREAFGWIESFIYQRNSYKRYTVRTYRECDGTITESVVPGSTEYYYTYCWSPTGYPCTWSQGSAYPVCY